MGFASWVLSAGSGAEDTNAILAVRSQWSDTEMTLVNLIPVLKVFMNESYKSSWHQNHSLFIVYLMISGLSDSFFCSNSYQCHSKSTYIIKST